MTADSAPFQISRFVQREHLPLRADAGIPTLEAVPDARKTPCFETEAHLDGACVPLVACPAGQVVAGLESHYPEGKSAFDDELIGLTLDCAEPIGVVITSESGQETTRDLELVVSDTSGLTRE